MKAVIQNYRSGELTVADLPAPMVRPGGILVRTECSLVSAGTEKLMVELARKSLLGKARERPDLVRQVADKIRRDGLLPTLDTVRRRLDTPVPLGYASAGTVLEVGERAGDFRPGDRVACAGAGYAGHAEVAFVPRNLAVKLPDEVSAEEGAFTTLGAIALQSVRLAAPAIGETVAVIGLGLVGLLAAQLARAAGCRVVGMDPDEGRCRLARTLGVEEACAGGEALAEACRRLTGGAGADAVIIAAGTRSSDPVALAGEIARDRGTVVAVGALGMDIPRKPYYEKELTFRVSRSYGPGRYDPEYEEGGRDYPIGYVRWTENRNLEAFVRQVALGAVRTEPLVTHRFPVTEALGAYDLITGKSGGSFLGVLLTYAGRTADLRRKIEVRSGTRAAEGSVRVGMLGAGGFATGVLLPAMQSIPGLELVGIAAATGLSARHAAERYGFRFAATDESAVIGDPEINTLAVVTRHHLHARQVLAGLQAGKHVFVEKPLCLTRMELDEIVALRGSLEPGPLLMVGYNRRFAPLALRLREFLGGLGEPPVITCRVNAGYLPLSHWTQDPRQGGGRIIGEVCHFVDFLTFLSGALPVRVYARSLPDLGRYREDNIQVVVEFANGAVGTITYTAAGDKAFPKERVEVFAAGGAAVLDNFRVLETVHNGRRKVTRSRFGQDKGHRGEWEAFARAITTPDAGPPIPFPELAAVTLATLGIRESLASAQPVEVQGEGRAGG